MLAHDHDDIEFAATAIDKGVEYVRFAFRQNKWCSCCDLVRKLDLVMGIMEPDPEHTRRLEGMMPMDIIKAIVQMAYHWDAGAEEPAEALIWRTLGFAYINHDSIWSHWGWEERQDHIDMLNALCEPAGHAKEEDDQGS